MHHLGIKVVAACALSATFTLYSFAAGPAEKLQITCMSVPDSMSGGAPSKPIIYTLAANGALLKGDIEISSFSPKLFSMTRDSEGDHLTNSQHEWVVTNQQLRRKVWQVGQETKGFFEIYDFKKQEVLNRTGEDTCNHRQYQPN